MDFTSPSEIKRVMTNYLRTVGHTADTSVLFLFHSSQNRREDPGHGYANPDVTFPKDYVIVEADNKDKLSEVEAKLRKDGLMFKTERYKGVLEDKDLGRQFIIINTTPESRWAANVIRVLMEEKAQQIAIEGFSDLSGPDKQRILEGVVGTVAAIAKEQGVNPAMLTGAVKGGREL